MSIEMGARGGIIAPCLGIQKVASLHYLMIHVIYKNPTHGIFR